MTVVSNETRLRCPHCGEAQRMTDKDALLTAARLLISAGQLDVMELLPVAVIPEGDNT